MLHPELNLSLVMPKSKEVIAETEMRAAYKLDLPSHVFDDNKCKKNCKNNPRCYVGGFF